MASSLLSTDFSLPSLSLLALITLPTYVALRLIYNITLHPLRSFPGPFFSALSVLPRARHLLLGDPHTHIAELHRQYGPVVRVAPDELSFADPAAWRDIHVPQHGNKAEGSGGEQLTPDAWFYNPASRPTQSMLGAPWEEHAQMRKAIAHGFSARALRGQEVVITGYVDLLMQRLVDIVAAKEKEDGSSARVDINPRMSFITFDVIGKLAFGSDFGCLDAGEWQPWVRILVKNAKNVTLLHTLNRLGMARPAIWFMGRFRIGLEARAYHERKAQDMIASRMAQEVTSDDADANPDLIQGLISAGFSQWVVRHNAGLLVAAGSDTTATLITGVVYFLTTHPDALRKLEDEVRGKFQHEGEITMTTVNELPWMIACLSEALRVYPPVANTHPRRTPKGGCVIAGHRVPGDVSVGMWHWATYRSAKLFADPDQFRPERWVEGKDGRYAMDRLDAVQPFSVGPRNCIGQNLAHAEMRLILARLVWNFDMTIADESKGWMDGQKVFFFWEKPAMYVDLKRVVR